MYIVVMASERVAMSRWNRLYESTQPPPTADTFVLIIYMFTPIQTLIRLV